MNISGKQFGQADFVASVLATLDLTGANPAGIKLELTETSLVEDFHEAVAKMSELKSHGLKFSVDTVKEQAIRPLHLSEKLCTGPVEDRPRICGGHPGRRAERRDS